MRWPWRRRTAVVPDLPRYPDQRAAELRRQLPEHLLPHWDALTDEQRWMLTRREPNALLAWAREVLA